MEMEKTINVMWLRSVVECRLFDLRHAQEELSFIPACLRGNKEAIRDYKAARIADVLERARLYEAAKADYMAVRGDV